MGSINNLFCLFDTSTFDEKDKKMGNKISLSNL